MAHPLHPYHKSDNECEEALEARFNDHANEKLCDSCQGSIESQPGYRCLPCNFVLCQTCSDGLVHPAHVGHTLYSTKRSNEPWTCGACLKSWEEISKRPHYICGECDFNLCEPCFESVKLPLHQHRLYRTDVRYTYHSGNGEWQCDLCHGNNGPENFFPRHCSACQFDACDDCCKARRTPLHEHLVYKADSMVVYAHYYGGWRCDHCSSRFKPEICRHPYHCPECSYDLCAQCINNPETAGGGRRQRILTRTAAGHPVTIPSEDEPEEEELTFEALKDDTLCVICLSNKKDATFIHGNTGHVSCCFTCAQELVRRGGSCPICRAPVERVIRQFSS